MAAWGKAHSLLALVAMLTAACEGFITDPWDPENRRGAGPGDLGLSVASSDLLRLTRAEYDNTVRDLLGDTSAPATGFSPDEKVGPFDANRLAPPSEGMLDDYLTTAEALAATAVADVAALTGCGADLGTDACAQRFIDAFGGRAYRRPLDAEQRARLYTVYAEGNALGGFAFGIELVVRAVLQSPFFLYRIEVGTETAEAPGIAKLDDHELASRLSYFLWDSMPDDQLFAAAEAGELATVNGIEAQAQRMLASPKAEPMVAAFHVQWMGLGGTLEKDTDVYPESTPALADSMRRETGLFATDAILQGDGTLSTLLTAPYTFADASIAAIYGADRGGAESSEFVRVDLDAAQRSGLLTRLGVLAATSHANETSIVLRGRFVRTSLLCQPLPPPPVDVDETDLGADRTQGFCASCHHLMDPIGQGLEQYDALGRFRPADAAGMITETDVDGAFDGGRELSERLAGSEQVRGCVARLWFRFALGRPEHDELDAGSLHAIDAAFEAGDVRELIVALTRVDAFRYRRMEVSP